MRMNSTFKMIAFLAIGAISYTASAQKITMPTPSPLQTVTQKFGLGDVTVEYSRPAAKGRTVFGDIVPFGKVWRTGANSTTKITFTTVVKIEGKEVKPGTYGVYSIPNKESWEVMLYTDLALNGNVAEYKTENEVARFKVPVKKTGAMVESFTINMDNVLPTEGLLTFSWENTLVALKVTTDIDAEVMKSIDESMKSEKPDYFRAAQYYLDNGKDLKQALTWVNKAVEANPTAFYMFYTKAKIEFALKDKAAGKASAEKTIALAKDAKNDDYIALGTKLLSENK